MINRKSPRHSGRKNFSATAVEHSAPLVSRNTKLHGPDSSTIGSTSSNISPNARTASFLALVCVLFFIYLQIINTTFTLSSLSLSPHAIEGSRALLRGKFTKTNHGDRTNSIVDVASIIHEAAQRAQAAAVGFEDDIVHVVYTRFMQTQHKLVELGKARAELFRAFCLPSMVHQTKQNFLWIIRTDPQLEDSLRKEMIEMLKPYPHFVLLSSNKDSSGFRNETLVKDIMDLSNVLAGDSSLIKLYHQAAQTRTVLETRLDADDALHVEFLENMQDTAREVFSHRRMDKSQNDISPRRRLIEDDSPSKQLSGDNAPVNTMANTTGKWMYWCADVHMEWHPGKADFKAGMLIARMPKHCVTPGLTKGYEVGMNPSDLPSEPHHRLLSRIKECNKDTIEQGGCVKRMDLIPSSLRARTVTSAGMADVGADVEGRTSDKWWEDIRDTFGILKEEAARTKRYLEDHEVDIAIENLKGQCTQGHSCKQRAKDRLNALLEEKKGNQKVIQTINSAS